MPCLPCAPTHLSHLQHTEQQRTLQSTNHQPISITRGEKNLLFLAYIGQPEQACIPLPPAIHHVSLNSHAECMHVRFRPTLPIRPLPSYSKAHLIPMSCCIPCGCPSALPFASPSRKTRRDPLPFLPLGERQSSRGERWRLCIRPVIIHPSVDCLVWFSFPTIPTNPYQKETWGLGGPTSKSKLKK
jgi:hypothetical protein